MKKEMEITNALKESLLADTGSLAAECIDAGLSFVDNPIIQSIPIASLLLGAAKIGYGIYTYWRESLRYYKHCFAERRVYKTYFAC